MNRGVTRKSSSTLVPVWVPKPLLAEMDAVIAQEDSDRSKFVRQALRDKVRKIRATEPAN